MDDEKTLLLFGLAVKRIRVQVGLTQEALSERCTHYKQHIAPIEDGTAKVTLDMVLVLAQALEIAPSVLLMEMRSSQPASNGTDLLAD